jgi:hypothetical protein
MYKHLRRAPVRCGANKSGEIREIRQFVAFALGVCFKTNNLSMDFAKTMDHFKRSTAKVVKKVVAKPVVKKKPTTSKKSK